MINTIQNNEQWSSVREKLNDVIAAINGIEASIVDAAVIDELGQHLTSDSLVLFQGEDGLYYKIPVSNFKKIVTAL